MFFLNRAASAAAVAFVSVLLACTTTPGFANELDKPSIATTTLNALTMPAVPTAPIVAPAATAPAEARVIFAPAREVAQALPQPAVATTDLDYDSLAEAVAAQDAAELDRELTCLAAGVFFESNGEPLAGQLAVAQTILNRTKSGRFAGSVCGVLTQRGQFSFVKGGVVPSAEGRGGWKTAVAVAKVAARELWESPASDALYFHARRVAPSWRATKIAAIGNHVFYR